MNRLTRTLFYFVVGAIASFFVFNAGVEEAKAYGTITNISVTSTNATESSFATYTVNFTPEHEINSLGGKVYVDFHGPLGRSSNNSFDFYSSSLNSSSTPTSSGTYSYGYQGFNFDPSTTIAAGANVSLVVDNVKNPVQGGKFFVHIWTGSWGYPIDGDSAWGKDYVSSSFEVGDNTNLVGTVTSSTGSPVPYSNVYIYKTDYSNYWFTYTDKDGAYGIADVPAGTYNVYLGPPPSTSNSVNYIPPNNSTVTVAADGVTTKNLAFLSTTKTISGTITKSGGGAVTDARVYAYRSGYGAYVSVDTDSSGNFSLNTSGGTWTVNYYPTNWPANWQQVGSGVTVKFNDDNSSESKTVDFTAAALNSNITGRLMSPDGYPITNYNGGISFYNSAGYSFWASPDSNGYFTTRATSGTYSASGWINDNLHSFPKVNNFSVGENETKNLGDIEMIKKSDRITGYVRDNFGNGVSGAYVNAWKNEGTYDYGYSQTGSDGSYTIMVTPGNWQVSTWPQWDSGYVYTGGTKNVRVTSGTAATQNFTFLRCTSTITGRITDPNGNLISDLYSYVSAGDGSQPWGVIGTSVTQGTFTLRVPSGTWTLRSYLYNADYDSPDPTTVSIGDNETKSVTLQAVRNNATIHGTVYDEDGNAVTEQWISIYAAKGTYGSWKNAVFDTSNGTYSMQVSAGDWNLGWWIDPATGYSAGFGQDSKISINANETKTYDIHLKKVNATITGTTKKSNGDAMQWMWVTADSRDPKEKTSSDMYYWSNGTSSNQAGNYSLRVPAGTYWVGSYTWSGSGYLNPKKQKITVEANKSVNVDLVFREADATINGKVTRDGEGASAFITAWSEDGAYAEANSDNNGNYALSVSKGTVWHIRAILESGKTVYKSREGIVDMTNISEAAKNLELLRKGYTLPEPVTVTFDATVQQVIALEDGTSITIEANAIASSGTITLVITPVADLAEEQDAKPLDYGYDFKAYDQSGREITDFNSEITIQDSYTSEGLDDANVQDEDELVPAYYDESAGTWQEINSSVVSEDENTVTYQTDHFTKYALVTASDTSAPSAPTNVRASAESGKISLSWSNAGEADVNGVVIYRSETKGELGSAIKTTEKSATSYEDTSVTAGTNYYYTLRSIDVSLNESTNSDQTEIQASSLPRTGSSTRNWLNLLGLIF